MKLTASLLTVAAAAAAVLAAGETAPRFDHVVREDFFAGFSGNAEALARAMKTTEAILKDEPTHPGALVWHGSGLFYQAGQAFRQADSAKGMDLYTRGMAEMDKAVELAPDHPGVRIPRGSVLMSAGRSMGAANPMARGLLEKALGDYLRVYDLQKDRLASLGVHPRGELLFGLADTYARLGNKEKAGEFFALLAEHSAGTAYAGRAAAWKQTGEPLPAAQTGCIGCHVK